MAAERERLRIPSSDVTALDRNDPTGKRTAGLRLLASLTHAAPVAIYHADPSGRITYGNALYQELFGLSLPQSMTQREAIVHPSDRRPMKAAWQDFRRDPRAVQFQWRSLASSGEARFLSETIVPLSVGGMNGFVGTITDVSDLRAAQAEVRELQSKLMDSGQFGGDAIESLRRNAQVAIELREALHRGEFELHYQPKLDVKTDCIIGAEALIRWNHPTRGLLTPADFIAVAEESGLIGPMGEWVITESCRQAHLWHKQGLRVIRIAVNLSPSQFRQGNLLGVISQSLNEYSLEPRYLEIELTESTVMHDAEGSAVILEQLSQMGVTLSIDDFGTGYSNLSYLRRFPVDRLKIDRSFIGDLGTRPDDASIVQAIISLAHNLRLKVVAEGVETVAQLDFLKAAGCDQYQGYYFSRPLPAAAFAQLLRSASEQEALTDLVGSQTHSKLSACTR